MLGHRGCRLGIAYPEITEMQARAIFEAAATVAKKGIKVKPEVMIPLVGFKKELDLQTEIVHNVAKQVMSEQKVKLDYLVGTMIEVPRGALTADEIAQTAQFFSFGTNDLTQTCLGISRDDMGNFLSPYTEAEIFKKNPFATLDATGVGQLIHTAISKGRSTNPNIKLGICGEHGGDPDSVKFCHSAGLTYVSCSPFRVPVARLAAAQAAIEEKRAASKAAAAATPVRGISAPSGVKASNKPTATNQQKTTMATKKAAKKAAKPAAKKAAKPAAKKAAKPAAAKKAAAKPAAKPAAKKAAKPAAKPAAKKAAAKKAAKK
jgi:pyruvate,orthophosphate dikinase